MADHPTPPRVDKPPSPRPDPPKPPGPEFKQKLNDLQAHRQAVQDQRRGIRDAVADSKTRKLESAVNFGVPKGRPHGGATRPEPIVVLGSDPLFKSDYLEAVRRRMSENNPRATYRMKSQDVVDANSLSPQQFAAMRARGARFIDLGDGDRTVTDPWVKAATDQQRARVGTRHEHYKPVFRSFPRPGDQIVTGDMQKQRVEPAAAAMRERLAGAQRVHTFDGPVEHHHKPTQIAENIAWTGRIVRDNPGRRGLDGSWQPDTHTVGYSARARNGPQGEFATMEDSLHRGLGSWRRAVDIGDKATYPDPVFPPSTKQ